MARRGKEVCEITSGTGLARARAIMNLRLFFLSSYLVLSGCSGSTSGVGSSGSGSDGATLFDTPEQGDVTPQSILGVWGGSFVDNGITFDTRWRFQASTITLATRCSLRDGRESETVGVTARARVSEDEITFLESKKDEKKAGDFTCRVNAQPRTLPACGDAQPGFERECFRLSGTSLTLYGNPLEKLELVKLSD